MAWRPVPWTDYVAYWSILPKNSKHQKNRLLLCLICHWCGFVLPTPLTHWIYQRHWRSCSKSLLWFTAANTSFATGHSKWHQTRPTRCICRMDLPTQVRVQVIYKMLSALQDALTENLVTMETDVDIHNRFRVCSNQCHLWRISMKPQSRDVRSISEVLMRHIKSEELKSVYYSSTKFQSINQFICSNLGE